MQTVYVICIDDQREVLAAIGRDLAALPGWVEVEECESAAECLELVDELDNQGEHIGVIISDQVMPGQSGVELLKNLEQDRRFRSARKMLLTGLATQQDTIDAINQAHIRHYVDKPWQSDELIRVVRSLLTEYVFDQGLVENSMLADLDQEVARNRMATVTF